MPHPLFRAIRPFLFSSAFILLGLISASAQDLVISGSASASLQTSYDPPEYGFPGVLQMSSTVGVPATINTSGASGYVDLEFVAPIGDQINVTPDASGDDLYISAYYVASSNAGLSLNGAIIVTFTGLVGTAPTFSSGGSYFGYSYGEEALDLDFNATTTLSDFSFTGIEISIPISGVGNNVQLSQSGIAQIQVSNDSYSGATPPNNPQLLSVTSPEPVPEPSAIAFLGLSAFSLPFLRRLIRRRTC